MDQIATLGYVSCTNQIATLGYISCTNHITAFGYHAPITAFGYCFLVNDAMESGGCAQKMTLTRNFGLIWWVLWLWPMQEPHRMRSRFIWISKVCVYFHCIILKLNIFFPLLFSQYTCQTTYISSHTVKTTSKVQSETTQSLHYMNIRQFFKCLNCILPIRFYFATLDFAPSHVISLIATCILSRILTILSNTTEKNAHETLDN